MIDVIICLLFTSLVVLYFLYKKHNITKTINGKHVNVIIDESKNDSFIYIVHKSENSLIKLWFDKNGIQFIKYESRKS